MLRHTKTFGALLLAASTIACAGYVPFTQGIREMDGRSLSDDEMRGLQFYLSGGLEIRRELASADRSVVRGRLESEQGRFVDVVEVPKGTPGVVTFFYSESRILVSFEEGATGFIFGPVARSEEPYCLLGNPVEGGWEVDFDGLRYRIDLETAHCLEIDQESLSTLEENRRVLGGRRINE